MAGPYTVGDFAAAEAAVNDLWATLSAEMAKIVTLQTQVQTATTGLLDRMNEVEADITSEESTRANQIDSLDTRIDALEDGTLSGPGLSLTSVVTVGDKKYIQVIEGHCIRLYPRDP